jgi:hypothetical protein
VFFRFEDTEAALEALVAAGAGVVGGDELWRSAGAGALEGGE